MLEQVLSWTVSTNHLLYLTVGLVSVWYIVSRNRTPKNIPPFPVKPYPILGHIPMMGKNKVKSFQEWYKTTGDIFSIYVGQSLVVVFNSYEMLKEGFVKNGDCYSDKCHRYAEEDPRFIGGIIDTSGPLWKEQRSVTVNILKKLGMGKNVVAERINREVKAYCDTIAKWNGEPKDTSTLITTCIVNVIWAIATGDRFELEDPQLQRLFEAVHGQVDNLRRSSHLRFFPRLRSLPGDLFGIKGLQGNEDIVFTEFCVKHINQLKETHDGSAGENVIHSYLTEEKERKKSRSETTLNAQNHAMVINNLLQGGTETTACAMMWVLLYATVYPDIQEKLYKEIKEVVGKERRPNLEDKIKMKYVNAFIKETQRLSTVVPFGVPRYCSKTTTIRGYTIPAGTMILPNFSAALLDEKNWGDPTVFRPERFLDESGNLVVPEYFIPFAIGRRDCLGADIGIKTSFLFTTSIIQQFQLCPEDPDNLPTTEPALGPLFSPQPFKIRFIPRQ